ncbi:MAG: hypothetical protein KGD73_07525 [Candidatus Lokiarchaeota archaeon]|nr:hypothetical protein [Candidatus Lokiarchaeota archaeon]
MNASNYELMFEYFATAEINNSSLKEYKNLINEYFSMEKAILSEMEIFKLIEFPAEIGNPKLEDFGNFFYMY